MRVAQLLKDIPIAATFLTSVCLAILAVKALVLNRLPPLFVGANELGGLVDAVLSSVIASYIFFVLVVHMPAARGRLLVRPHLAKHAKQVLTFCHQQLHAIGQAAGVNLTLDALSPSDIKEAFGKIDPNAAGPMVFYPGNRPATWLEFLSHYVERSDSSITRTLANVQFVDAELVRCLTNIEDSDYFLHMRLTSGMEFRNPNLSSWAEPFFKYCLSCKGLSDYCEASFAPNVP